MKNLTYFQLRKLWIKFWTNKNHEFKKSVSLISKDESLLWVNSGVAGLKDYFLGIKKPSNKRIVNIQKSLRTKDILKIGITNRHLTFFEMLGNFSIGDYFKKESLEWAWEFLTDKKLLNLDPEKIFITYFNEDLKAFNILKKLNNINEKNLISMGRKTNFWDLGVGPCGPNVEFYYDLGNKYDLKNKGINLIKDDIENDRYLEVWNVVFSQFVNIGNQNYKLLENKNIDTGAGLERILTILQEKENPFETDLFDNSLKLIKKILNKDINLGSKNNKDLNIKIKIILDHSRAITFLISDLLVEKKEINFKNKKGYILRRIIRNACLQFYFLKIDEPKIYKICEKVVEKYSEIYPELKINEKEILKLVKNEEEIFFKLLKNKKIKELLKLKNSYIDGKTIFNLVSSYGIPLEIIKNISNNNNIKLDIKTFNNFWVEHQKISNKKEWSFQKEWKTLFLNGKGPTKFFENKYELKTKILGIFENNKSINSSNDIPWVIFEQTPFYAEKGGQDFDIGNIILNGVKSQVINVQFNNRNQILHKVKLNNTIKVGDEVILKIDKIKRDLTRKNHSSTHLLHSLLRSQISDQIKQNGSFNNEKYLRLDFYSDKKIFKNQIIKIEQLINQIIEKKIKSEIIFTSLEESKKMGALSFFEDFYDKSKVRVVKFNDFSTELCGGTHVLNTSEIESFRIIEFKTISKNVYRIYAITTYDEVKKLSINYLNNLNNLLKELKNKINYLNDLNINKEINKLKKIPDTFIGYKEIFENFKNLINENFKNKRLNEIKKNINNYKLNKNDIFLKNNFKILIHKISINVKERYDFSIILFDYLKKKEYDFVCLLDELKPEFFRIIFIDKTNKNLNWEQNFKNDFNENFSGNFKNKKFKGLIKNFKLNKIKEIILNYF